MDILDIRIFLFNQPTAKAHPGRMSGFSTPIIDGGVTGWRGGVGLVCSVIMVFMSCFPTMYNIHIDWSCLWQHCKTLPTAEWTKRWCSSESYPLGISIQKGRGQLSD